MKIVTPADNGPQAHQPGHGLDMHDSRRRHDALVRRVSYAREAGLAEAGLNLNSKGAVANAAHALVQTYQMGKVSRQQIEEEQRADETRLKGWQVAKPQPGTIHEDEIPRIKYRMAVRSKALAEIATLDLAVMIGSTGKTQKALAPTPHATPWRSGTGYSNSPAKRGKPIGLREYNHCHEPAGSKSGGQFSSGSDCGGGGAKEPSGGGSGGGNVAKDWSDYGYGAKGYGQRQDGPPRSERDYPPPPGGWDQYQKLHPPMGTTLRDRVKKIDPEKRLKYAEDRVNRVIDDAGKNIGPQSATRQRKLGPSSPTGTIFRDEPSEYGAEAPKPEPERKKLPIVHAGSPLRTNASINRDTAMTAFKAGMTAREIARAWPAVFKVDSEGKLGQKYDYELGDGSGRYETNRMITRDSLKDVLARHKAKAKR